MQEWSFEMYRVSLYPKADKVAGGTRVGEVSLMAAFPTCLEQRDPSLRKENQSHTEIFSALHCLDFKVYASDADEAVAIAKQFAGRLFAPLHDTAKCRFNYSEEDCGNHFVCNMVQLG